MTEASKPAGSALAAGAIEAAGLGDVMRAREAGQPIDGLRDKIAAADILALGALADRVRAREVGDHVRVTMSRDPHASAARLVRAPDVAPDRRGLAFLRAIALADRLGGYRAVRLLRGVHHGMRRQPRGAAALGGRLDDGYSGEGRAV